MILIDISMILIDDSHRRIDDSYRCKKSEINVDCSISLRLQVHHPPSFQQLYSSYKKVLIAIKMSGYSRVFLDLIAQ